MLDPTISPYPSRSVPSAEAIGRSAAAPPKLRHLTFLLVVFASPFFLLSAARAETVVRSVGSGPSCDFDDLETAVEVLLDLPADERVLKIERGLVEGVSLEAFGASLTLRGGFESCGDAAPRPGAKTLLLGTGTAPVVALGTIVPLAAEPPDPATFRIENLEIQGGRHGLQIRGPADVLLADSLILGNEAPQGGGISVLALSGPVTLELLRTGVNGNRTVSSGSFRPDGGGLRCVGAGGLVRALDGTVFVGNSTSDDGHGGGLFLEGCTFEARGDVKIQLNRAHRGGGIAGNRARITLRGDAEGPVQVSLNRAEERLSLVGQGGGLYLESGSDLEAHGVLVEDNRALPEIGTRGGSGGGLFVTSSTARLDRPGLPCPASCSVVGGNRAAFGAAATATRSSYLELRRTRVDGNVGDTSVLEASSGSVSSSSLDLEQVFLTRNLGSRLVDLVDIYRLEVRHASVGGNLELDSVVFGTGSGTAHLTSSVLFEPGVDLARLPEPAALSASCMVVHDASTLRNAFDVVEADPRFVDRLSGDLHLEATSPAVDLCPSTLGATFDIDGQTMPVDQPTVPDDATPADAGADEVPFLEAPRPEIFSDGFESGDGSAWSRVVS